MTSLERWTKLQTYLKKNLFDKGLYTLEMWLPITDKEIEGVWKDFYTKEILQNYTHPWGPSEPNGGEDENCVALWNKQSWYDESCKSENIGCMCAHAAF